MHEQAQRPEALQPGAAESWPAGWKWALAAILLATAVVFVAGATSRIVLGDEVYHTMFARAWAEAGLANRPTHNPLYASGEPPGYYYVTEPVWPRVLGLVWQATGCVPWVAQAYQALWYALVLALVWVLGRDLLGPRGALAAVLAAISVPMVGAFSVMLYVDTAATAVILAAVVLLLRRHFFWAGVLVGLAYLTKRNAVFLVPPMVLWIVLQEGSLWQRARRLALFLLPAALVVWPDLWWRRHWIPGTQDPVNPTYVLRRVTMFFSPQRLSSNINNPVHLLMYLGGVLPLGVAVYLARRAWDKADRWLWVFIAFYAVTLFVMFTLDTDVRYVMPIVPLFTVMVARGLRGWWKNRWVLVMLAAVAFVQLGVSAVRVNLARRLTPGQQAVFAYLRTHTPEGTRVMYPGEVIMAEARRPVVWNHLTDPETREVCITPFLIQYGPEKMLAVLRANRVDYLCVEKSRILSGPLAKAERGGYPRAFVDNLPNLPFIERVEGDWPDIQLWRVKDAAEKPNDSRADG
ncbi:MAG TPA: glycosyltransferase family 39 protein [Phycisphaerae bacterium]|nr:glycosyltransferase family 39 protein [Phycisphaerae bacterium]